MKKDIEQIEQIEQVEQTEQAKVIEPATKKKRSKAMILGVVLAVMTLCVGAFATYVILAGQRSVSTGNARVTTDLLTISSTTPGLLERFNIYEGMRVEAGQIIGWVQYGETFRSPVDGIVVNTSVSTGQQISPMEPLAIIADINNLHIQANLYESDIQDIRLGQPAAVTLDGIRGRTFGGYVRNISRITEVELAGQPVQVSTGTFRRITHTVPIEVVITDDVDLSYFLGTNARVSLPVLASAEGLMEVAVGGDISTQITATGRVESIISRNIYPSQALRIENVLVRLGDFVEVGHVLATLDTADLETSIYTQRTAIDQLTQHSHLQTLETQRMLNTALANISNDTNMHIIGAQSNLTASQQQLENAQRMYNQARLDYENRTTPQVVATDSILQAMRLEQARLSSDYANMSILYNAGALSRQEMQQIRDAAVLVQTQYSEASTNYQNAREAEHRNLEQMRAALDSAQTTYESAAATVRSTELAARQEIDSLRSSLQMAQIDGVEQMYHSLAQMERHLQDGVITAPISGTVTAVYAEPGEFSMARLFTVETLDELRVLANVREYDLPNIYAGQPVTVTAYATGDQVHTGTVTRISPRAVSISPVVEFEIEITITSDYSLLPGMSARIQIDVD